MRLPLYFLGLIALAWGCETGTSSEDNPLSYFPPNTYSILQIHNTQKFRNEFQNNPVLTSFKEILPDDGIKTIDSLLALELGENAFVAWSGNLSNQNEWVLIFKEPVWNPSDSLDIAQTAWKLPDSSSWHTAKTSNLRIVTSSRQLLNSALNREYRPSGNLSNILKTSNTQAGGTFIFKSDISYPLSGLLVEQPSSIAKVNTWSAFDLLAGGDNLWLRGFEQLSDSIPLKSDVLRNISVLPLADAAQIAPSNCTAFYSFSLRDTDRFLTNQKERLNHSNHDTVLVQNTDQLTLIELDEQVLIVLHSVNPDEISSMLEPVQYGLPEFQETPVFSLQQNSRLKDAFKPLINQISDPGYYTRLDNLFVFAPTLEALQNWISAFKREASLASNPTFKGLKAQLLSESTAMGVVQYPSQSTLLKDPNFVFSLPEKPLRNLPENYAYIVQLSAENRHNQVSFQFASKSSSKTENRVDLLFTLKLEGTVSTGPYFLKNHLTGGMDIAVQDNLNQLYLFSNKGELQWKKTISGPIQGSISQLDIAKNGALQMAFTTQDKLEVLDQNGKSVDPFPLDFPGGNLNPLSLFDYENNRDYRLVVTQGAKVFMYNAQGKQVNGFKFKDAESPITKSPQHMRIGNRDYLVFRLENGTLKILNRTGDTRVKINETFTFSENPIFLFENTFTFTDRKGNLISIEPSGKISRRNLNLNTDHGMYATARTLALMNDNVLKIKGNQTELDLGVYNGPQIHYLNDVIYVATTDLQSNKLYLFKSTAERFPGFPIESQSLPDMADIDGDRNPELTVRYRDSVIAIYGLKR
jgi:hypothetical protein